MAGADLDDLLISALLIDAVAAHDPVTRLADAMSAAWNAQPVRLHVEPGPGQSVLMRLDDVEVQLEGGHVREFVSALNAASRSAPV